MISFYFCLLFGFTSANHSTYAVTNQYVEQYAEIARIEMNRVGIPASIKLAQAILESNSGTSSFSQNSNNHFGIKCKSYWKGGKYYHKDDDLDTKGKLIESCFRAYESVLDSYIDHSNFIKASPYYSNIFNLKQQDYVTWAKGLQHYGYATDPAYADKLIRIIERHQLYQFDQVVQPKN